MQILAYENGQKVIREMTEAEAAEEERMWRELEETEHCAPVSVEERLDALETTTDDMILIMAELIGGE